MALKPLVSQPPLFRRLLEKGLREQPWQKQVEAELEFFGWWYMVVPPNVVVCPKCRWKIFRGVAKGWPDIVAIRPPEILFIELKAERGQLRPEQTMVGAMLRACGLRWIHARPRDREELRKLIARPEAP